MSSDQVMSAAMALPLAGRVSLAQRLWESINTGLVATDEIAAAKEALRRHAELSSGAVKGRTHDEVMKAARRATGCA